MADGYLNFDTKINEQGFNKGVSKLGSIAKTGLGVAVGNIMTDLVKNIGGVETKIISVGAAFEAEMSKVSAISGAVGDDLALLSDKAKEMGAKTKFSATESAQAMEYMAMAGWKTEDMLGGIEGVMNLAAASGESLAATSDIVTDALTAFGMSASDSGRFADVLAAASSNANTNVGLMGETFKYVAPVAGALGFSVEDTAVAIGLMANSGIKAGQAGTALRAILSRMVDPTDDVQAAMDKLGISLTDSQGSMKSFDSVIGDLRGSFAELSEAEKTQMAATLGGQEAMSGLLAIVNASDSDFDKLKNSIYNCKGAAADMAATMQDNLKGQLTLLKSATEGLGIEIYESLQKPLTSLAKVAVSVMSDLNKAYAEGVFVGFLDAIGEKVPIVQKLTDAIGDLVGKLQGMSSEQLIELAKTIAVVAGSVPVLSALGGGISAIGAAVEGFEGAVGEMTSGIGKIPDSLKGIPKSLSDVGKSFGTLNGAITGPFEVLAPKLTNTVKKTFSILPNTVSGFVGKIGPAIKGKFPSATSALSGLGEYTSYLGAWGGQIGGALQGVLGSVSTFIPGFIKLMNFGLVAGALTAGLGLLYSQFGTQIDEIILMMQTKGSEIITDLCNGIVSELPNLIAQGGTMLNSLIEAITANLPAIIDGGIAIVSTLITGIAQQLPTLIPTALQMILTLVTSLLSNVGQLVDAGINLLTGLAEGVVNAIPILIANAPTIIGQLASAIISNLPKILQAGIQILVMLATGLIKAIPQLIGKIPEIISQVKNAFTSVNWGEVGKNIISGIASGLASAAGAIADAAKSAAKSALDTAKNFLGIHSPSRVFRDQVGKMMALGMGMGFEKNIPFGDMNRSLNKTIDNMDVDSIKTRLNSAMQSWKVEVVKSAVVPFDMEKSYSSIKKQNDKNFEFDYERLGKEMSKRPISVSCEINGRELIKIFAVPMMNQIDENKSFQNMLRGVRTT